MNPDAAPHFFWYELATTDLDGAIAFYRKVVGWDTKDSGLPGMRYEILAVGASPVGGAMTITPEMAAAGVRPCWSGYIGVADTDATVAKIAAAGGRVLRAPGDIPDVGRFAVVADPHGAVFMILHGTSDQPPATLAPGTPGGIGWHELHAGDGEAALRFYSGLFGWTALDAMDMGPQGKYQIYSIGGPMVGGIMTKMPQTPAPFWLFYFNVEAIDAAIARTTAAGGTIVHGPMEVPGGSWIANCLDPQGAFFALVAPKR